MATDITLPDPGVILDLLEAFRRSKVLFAAVSLGVFDALQAEPKPLAALAKELLANEGALERLLDAAVGLGLLSRAANGYQNTPLAATYLTRSSPHRFTGYLNFSNNALWKMWEHLEDAVREGSNRWKQTYGWDGPIFSHFFSNEEMKNEFLMGMHGFGLVSSPQVVSAFDLSRFRHFVDLGGATGHLAIAACQRYVSLRATVFDLPEAMPLAHEIVGASSVADRIELKAGDFFTDPLPDADLFAVGRILHDWSEERIRLLLRKMYDRLPVGGALLIAEKLLAEDKNGPRWALMQSLNMLVCTDGKERTLSEYETLLKEAGFVDVQGCRNPGPLDAVLAFKRG